MSVPSEQLADVEKEVSKMNEEIPHTEDDDIVYLSAGKPFFDVILSKNQVNSPFQLFMPSSMIPLLPHATVPVVLRHGGKNWNLSYMGDFPRPRFDASWGTFVAENHLKLGDACVFELMENTSAYLRFKVQVLRHDDMPSELLQVIESSGMTLETPICID